MVYTFDVDKHIEEYTKAYDKLPDKADTDKNPAKDNIFMSADDKKKFDEPSKENTPEPKERKKQLEDLIKDNKDSTACVSCPKQGKCKRLNWDVDHSFIKVTGCSKHPDQVKFKGHSTTIEITNIVGVYGQRANANWTTCRDFLTWDTTGDTLLGAWVIISGGIYFNSRCFVVVDTTVLPVGATVVSANYKVYVNYLMVGNGTRDLIILQNGAPTYPADPPINTDFNRTNYSAEIGSAARNIFTPIGAQKSIPFSDLTKINKTGDTKFAIQYSADIDNEAPTVEGAYCGAQFEGPNTGTPPKLEITYDLPMIISPGNPNKKQMVI